MSEQLFYEKISKKLGDVKILMIDYASNKELDKIIELWNKIRNEGRFAIDMSNPNIVELLQYHEYCGTTLQDELMINLKKKLTSKEYKYVIDKVV